MSGTSKCSINENIRTDLALSTIFKNWLPPHLVSDPYVHIYSPLFLVLYVRTDKRTRRQQGWVALMF
jgi:hypothetical protein